MSHVPESPSAAPEPADRVDALSADVTAIKEQLSDVLTALKAPGQPTAAIAETDPAAAGRISTAVEAYKVGTLQFTLPPPSANTVAEVLSTRQAYGETGKLNLFEKPRHLAPYPSTRFIPEPEGLFNRIKSADTRDGWESEVLWNIGHNQENALAACHKVAEALAAGDASAATDAFSIVHHFTQSTYERVTERVDFFTDALDSGKSEAILLQKYLREDDHPYTSALYRNTKKKFAELRSQAYAKEFNKQNAQGSRKGGNNFNNNNNNNNNNNFNNHNKGKKHNGGGAPANANKN